MSEKENEVIKDYKDIKEDYTFDPSIFNQEDERSRKVKFIINNRLSLVDKTIIILYAEYQSYRTLGKKLGLSHMTIRKEVIRIRKKIIEEYEHLHSVDIGGSSN